MPTSNNPSPPRHAETTDHRLQWHPQPLEGRYLQHATTELLHWLVSDYELQEYAAHTLLGQAVRYQVGNLYDPAYTMVCTLDKAVLAQLSS